MKIYGLIGYPLGHSFSKKYFSEKFQEMGLEKTHRYDLFEMPDPSIFPKLFLDNPDLCGVNVTIPHKQSFFSYLDGLDQSAERVGAVNVIKKTTGNKLIGYNSDYYGFKKSFEEFTGAVVFSKKALILGYGGAAKAIVAALQDLDFKIQLVSRTKSDIAINYEEAKIVIPNYPVIINCSPVGTYPNTNQCPDINYDALNHSHFLYDLIYNPAETLFLKKGKDKGAKTKNGYDMLVNQAEKSWEIWNN